MRDVRRNDIMGNKNKNVNLLMAPEWLMYPNIPYGSIGWRTLCNGFV